MSELSPEEITNLLKSKPASKGKSTEPREISVWYQQDHILRQAGCTNPACQDPRPKSDVGTQIVMKFDNEFMCRHCFLNGWLSPNAD